MVTCSNIRPTKAYSYIRMSTDLQLKGDSLRRQRRRPESTPRRKAWNWSRISISRTSAIPAYAGKNIASGSFGRFLEAVREGKIERGSYLLVESFDRMSRQEPIVALQAVHGNRRGGLILVTLDDERVFSGKISSKT